MQMAGAAVVGVSALGLAAVGSASAQRTASPAPVPSAPDANGCVVVVLDLYPHGDHLHVADVHRLSMADLDALSGDTALAPLSPVPADPVRSGPAPPPAGPSHPQDSLPQTAGRACSVPIFMDEWTLVLSVAPPVDSIHGASGGRGSRVVIHRLDGAPLGAEEGGSTWVGAGARLIPGGSGISFIRPGGAHGPGSLYRLGADGGEDHPVLPMVDDVVAHEWVTGDIVALLRDGSPGALWLGHLQGGGVERVAEGVLDGPARIPGEDAVSFVEHDQEGRGWVRRISPVSGSVETLVDTPPGSQLHTWMPAGPLGAGSALVMAHDGVLYRFEPGHDRFWHPILNLNPWVGAPHGFVFSPSGLRLVVVVG